MTPDAIIDEVKASNLRGRGGAGFPTGHEVDFCVPSSRRKPKYILCNGDESEPGTCKDRLLIENDPHQLIEGILIAGLAVGLARRLHLHSRRIPLPDRHHGQRHRRSLRARLPRQKYFGSGFDFDLYTHTGAGAYEVRRRIRADGIAGRQARLSAHPAALPCRGRAVWRSRRSSTMSRPSARAADHSDGGADWFAGLGTPKNGGTRLFCLSGHVNKPGIYELPMGFNLKQMIYDVGGGIPDGKN